MTPSDKMKQLRELLQEKEKAVVAFSGGIDSTFLLYVARQVMGDNVLAVTCDAGINSRREMVEARQLAGLLNIKHRFLYYDFLLQNDEFLTNPPQRCYICKRIMMEQLKKMAGEMGVDIVMDGANADDGNDYRPGLQAAREMGILSPLQEVGLGKDEIRFLSRREGLPVWDKPSSPCLCSRIPYGRIITREKLSQIEKGEEILQEAGFREVRLRHHGDVALIEVPAARIPEVTVPELLKKVTGDLKRLGFKYIALDLEGFRSGSLNEML